MMMNTWHKSRMLLVLTAVTLVWSGLLSLKPEPAAAAVGPELRSPPEMTNPIMPTAIPAQPVISPVFTPEIQYWADEIQAWAAAYDLEPNIVAILMQIESCGDPTAVSPAGARGLFQVMPFHFQPDENMFDPDTNARRGLNYFNERLAQTGGNWRQSFAGYNGGHVAAASSPAQWAAETQAYVHWAGGILADIQQGARTSETLQAWLKAGGESLCQQAAVMQEWQK